MSKEKVDVLVIGAGPSGVVSSAYLHNQGIKVKVVERQIFPRFVIGESLIPRCMDHFREVGLFDVLDQQGYQKKFGARFLKHGKVCEFDFSKKFTEGSSWTWQLPRAHMDNVLVEEIQRKGVDVSFETTVTNVEFNGTNSVTTVVDKEGNESQIEAKFVIDSSGYGRVLPRLLDLEQASDLDPRSSLFVHVEDINRPEGQEGWMITFDVLEQHVWFWVIPFSNGKTSLGFVASPEYFEKGGTKEEIFDELLKNSPYFYDRFKDAPKEFDPVLINAFSVGIKQLWGEGYALTGNSTEFLDPVFSSGVTFATESGLLAAKLAARQIKGENVDWQTEYTDYIMQGVETFKTYVKTWYTGELQDIFFVREENKEIKKQICSVLAGYVWDTNNQFVRNHKRAVSSLAKFIRSTYEDSNTAV
ncbi:MAG: pyridine nucleotide-disulfide oxidoreductase [Crocinitomicaceae bacterium]|nr:pyridine nucleotide-disulfide oxidoreductase [Crocinitomicaceae bacterium]|tara:strand:+ start:1849 stop:3096 length:1248 start_codon:yes stop_codon:yes gene_type:complete